MRRRVGEEVLEVLLGRRAAVVSAIVAAGWAAALPCAATSAAPVGARAARVLAIREEGHLRYVTSSGSAIFDAGAIGGTIAGSTRVRFVYDGSPVVRAQFTIWSRGGTLAGHGEGRLSNPNSPAPSFRGRLWLTGGSGRWAHASGGGELFGVYDRRSYGLVVQVVGRLRY